MSARIPVLDAPGAGERPAANCFFARGCGDAPAPVSALPAGAADHARNHPCYSAEAHHHFARMHVAVAPACNIRCHYCNRRHDCANESRPGVASERLTPDQAVRKVLAVAARVPQLAVVGIAGPGDPLANPRRTFDVLERLSRAAPDLTLCLSTNGLALPEQVGRIASLGVRHVTVTVNMVDPEVGERIYPWVIWNRRMVRGRTASAILSARQLEGIERLREKGILCKVNSVLIPGVNDSHLPEVSRTVKRLGAFVHNIMPLLSAPEHGTHYGLTGQRGPSARELEEVRRACENGARVMRHCRQCRADAVGLLGEDRGEAFALARLPPEPARDLSQARAAYRAAVERRRERLEEARREAAARAAAVDPGLCARVAVATKGEGLVNQHFGHAREFLVYDVARTGARLVGHRTVERYCRGGEGDEDTLAVALRAIGDCHAVLVARVGACPKGRLQAAGIEPVTEHAFEPIEAAALGWLAGLAARVARGEARAPAPRREPAQPEAAAESRAA